MAFLKPQSPLVKGNDYFYPLTTADQVIMDGGYRLDQIVGKVEKSTVTLYQNGWSAAAPYSYSIVVNGLADDLNMQVFPHYSEDFAEKQALKEEFAKVSFCSRQGNIVTFECWNEVPNVNIDVDIEVNVMYPIEMALEEEIEARLPKLNYSIVGGTAEPSNPTENMIWVNTDQPITDYIFSKNEPQNPIEGMVWIYIGENSNVAFHSLNINGKKYDEIYPIFAKQYASGAWIDKAVMSYQNNIWVEWWNHELYNAGNEYTFVTGGWSSSGYEYSTGWGIKAGTKQSYQLYVEGVSATFCLFGTQKQIDLTGVNFVVFEGKCTGKTDVGMYFVISKTRKVTDYAALQTFHQLGDFKIEIPVDTLTGSYYISFYSGAAASCNGYVTQVYVK